MCPRIKKNILLLYEHPVCVCFAYVCVICRHIRLSTAAKIADASDTPTPKGLGGSVWWQAEKASRKYNPMTKRRFMLTKVGKIFCRCFLEMSYFHHSKTIIMDTTVKKPFLLDAHALIYSVLFAVNKNDVADTAQRQAEYSEYKACSESNHTKMCRFIGA